MKSCVYLNVNGKLKNSSEINYEDLIVLFNQYQNKHDRLPKRKEFVLANNMPSYGTIRKILDNKGITIYEFMMTIGDISKNSLDQYMSVEEKISHCFPCDILCGLTLYYEGMDEEKINDSTYLNLHDQEGYKYQLSREYVLKLTKENITPKRFNFKNKTFLKYNFDHYLSLNDCIYKVSHISPDAKYGDKIELVSIYNDIENITMKSIISLPKYLKQDGYQERKNKILTTEMTKEMATKIIYDMQSRFNRPLTCYDFNVKTTDKTISWSMIIKFWGSITNMQNELGLMTVKRTINDLISYVNNVCNYVKSQGRDTVSVSDFTPDLSEIQYQSIHKRFIEEGIDINKIINNNGLNFQKRGIGYTHVFEDGEKVLSSYEYMFSNILRKNSLQYNKDYYKDVGYSKFIKKYNGNMTCDYVLSTGDNILCVELAGMLRSKKYCDSFLNNCEIEDSETLENYRVSLNRKSELLKENDINHMILLLWDFNEEMFDRIIKGFYGLNNTI